MVVLHENLLSLAPTADPLKQETKQSSPLLRNLGKFRYKCDNGGLTAKAASGTTPTVKGQ